MFRLLSIAFLTLLLSACIDVESAGTNNDAATARTVSVAGHAEVKTEADQAMLHFAIELRGKTLAPLQEQAGQIMTDFLALTRDLNISQVQTSQILVDTDTHWQDGERVDEGFILRRNINIKLLELDKLGDLIERSLALGVNSIRPPQLQSSKAEALRQEALAAAAADARAKAMVLAQQLGATLGPVRYISTQGRPAPITPRVQMLGTVTVTGSSIGAAETYQPGMITFTGDVYVEFDLLTD